MDAKAVFLSSLIAFAVALSAAMAQGVPPSGGITVPADRPLVPPGLGSGSELERYNDTYIGLHSFWSDDIISRFFKHVADGTLPDGAGDAFTLLTTEPGPDVAPIHGRQMVVLDRRDWLAWLDLTRPESEVLRPLPAGSLAVEQVR